MSFATAVVKEGTKKSMGLRVTLPATGIYSEFIMRFAPQHITGGALTDWQHYLIDHSEIAYDSKGFGGGIVDMSDVEFTIADGLISDQPYGTLLSHLREVYTWYGAQVIAYLLCEDEDGTDTSQEIWYGTLVDWRRKNKTEFTFKAVANLDLEKIVPTTVITRVAYPLAPAASIGLPLPIVYGDFLPQAADGTESNAWNKLAEQMGLGDYNGALPTVCTAQDEAGAGLVCTVAEHVFKTLTATGQDSKNLFCRVDGDDQLAILTGTLHNSGTAHADIGTWTDMTVYIRPQGINAVANTASNPLNACDGKLTTVATIGNGMTRLALDFTRPQDRGYIQAVMLYVVFDTYTTDADTTIRYGFYDPNAASWWGSWSEIAINSSGTDEIRIHTSTAAAVYAEDIPDDIYVRIETINTNVADVATIGECAVVVQYYNRHAFVTTTDEGRVRHRPWGPYWEPRLVTNTKIETVPLGEFLGDSSRGAQVYVGGQGKADDGSGTITGTPDNLLETPAHVLYDFLVNVLGIAAVTTSSLHGSFATVATDQAADALELAFGLHSQAKGRDIVEQICRQSAMLFYRRPTTGLPAVVYWNSAVADNDYGTVIPFSDVFEIEIGETPAGDVRNAIYGTYDYSFLKSKCTKVCYFDGAGQDDGLGGTLNGPVSLVPYATSITRYGRRELPIRLDMHRFQPSACNVRNFYGEMQVEPRVQIKLKLPWKYWDMEIGHVIRLDNDSFQDAGYRYPGCFRTGTPYAGYWSFSTNHHRFWVERVIYSKRGYMEIVATEGVW